jgi:hypothetical protein
MPTLFWAAHAGPSPHVGHVSRGDVVLLPRGDPHHISEAGNRAPGTALAGAAENDAPEEARWLCGTFTIGDPQASHLLASLPAVIILRGARGPALEGLEVARRLLVFEMQSPSQGSAVMVARILDLIFIQICAPGPLARTLNRTGWPVRSTRGSARP